MSRNVQKLSLMCRWPTLVDGGLLINLMVLELEGAVGKSPKAVSGSGPS